MASGLLDVIAPVLFAMTLYVTYVSLVSAWFLTTLTSGTFLGLVGPEKKDWQGGA
jgi:hypothetical protein